MTTRVTLIQGGGIGYDQAPAVQRILEAAGVRLEWDEHLAGQASVDRGGDPMPKAMLESVRATKLALKTKLLSPHESKQGNFNIRFRHELGLFASVRPIRNLKGMPARFDGVDLLVIRELTEDLYAAIEHEIVPGVVQSLKVVTEKACSRFFRFAFDWAVKCGRKNITCVHKANILKLADGLFLDSFRSTAKDYPGMQTRELIVDNCCMQMVLKPQQFDVLVMGNLYGDLISDLSAGVVGGIAATAGINVGEGIHVYEAIHGAAREVVGMDRATPLPLLMPAIDLLEAIDMPGPAKRILTAVETVLTEGRVKTLDMGGAATTTQLTEAIIAAL